jgi:alpha-methylacyl-CoA racemase
MPGPLHGMKILDFSTLLPGPFATLALADMGAEVVCIKAPGRAEVDELMGLESVGGLGPIGAWLGRGKRSIHLNLKHPDGLQVIRRLLTTHDILVEQFRPGVMARLGLGWDDLQEDFPKLIYCSLTGYGQDGAMADRAGHDINYLSRSGLMGHSGQRDQGPVLSGMQIADVASGSYGVVIAVLAALVHRMQTGQGQHLDVSMTDGSAVFNAMAAACYLANGKDASRESWQLNGGSVYDFYECADGGYISFGGLEPQFSAAFFEAIGLSQLAEGRVSPQNQEQAKALVAERIKEKTRDEWTQVFSRVDACVEPVLGLAEALESDLAKQRAWVQEVPRLGGGMARQLGLPLKFSATPPEYGPAGEPAGTHSKEIMAEAGYSPADIHQLEQSGLFG